jgi:hypothetical protein
MVAYLSTYLKTLLGEWQASPRVYYSPSLGHLLNFEFAAACSLHRLSDQA